MTMDPRAVMRRAEQLKAERQNHESHWEEVAQHLLPHRSFTSTPTPGTKRREFIFNTMPVAACEQLAAGLHGMLTGPSVRWFALRPLAHRMGEALELLALWHKASPLEDYTDAEIDRLARPGARPRYHATRALLRDAGLLPPA